VSTCAGLAKSSGRRVSHQVVNETEQWRAELGLGVEHELESAQLVRRKLHVDVLAGPVLLVAERHQQLGGLRACRQSAL
jgi:hypothetical protein